MMQFVVEVDRDGGFQYEEATRVASIREANAWLRANTSGLTGTSVPFYRLRCPNGVTVDWSPYMGGFPDVPDTQCPYCPRIKEVGEAVCEGCGQS